MLRTGASRSILRSLNTTSTPTFKASTAPIRQQLRSQLCTASRRPQIQAFAKPLVPKTKIVARWASGDRPTVGKIDHEREERIQQKKIEAHPESVSMDSSTVQHADSAAKAAAHEEEPQMMSAIYSDLVGKSSTMSWMKNGSDCTNAHCVEHYS